MIKKTLALATTLTFTSLTALAGGPDPLEVPAAPAPQAATAFYVEANAGMAWQDWKAQETQLTTLLNDRDAPAKAFNAATWKNESSRFLYGFDAGWQMLPAVSLEGGFFNFADTTLSAKNYSGPQATKSQIDLNATIKSWVAYLGLRFNVFKSQGQQFEVFTKLAAAYSHNTLDGTRIEKTERTERTEQATSSSFKSHFWTGLAGIGAQYNFDQHFYVGVQGLYILGSDGVVFKVPATTAFMGVFGMRF